MGNKLNFGVVASAIKKFTTLVMATILTLPAVSVLLTNTAFANSGGDGTAGNPYLISNCEDLVNVDDDLAASYKVTTDLECTADGYSASIGSQVNAFSGTFDGGSHAITVAIDTGDADDAGLFQKTNGAQIKSVVVDGTVTGNWATGGLIGRADDTTVSNVTVNADVVGGSYVGGVVGFAVQTALNYAVSTGTVDGSGSSVGGVVGYLLDGTAEAIQSTGAVSAQDKTGGVVGEIENSNISYSDSIGTVEGNDSVGGLIGLANFGTSGQNIFQSHATGSVHGRYNVGGLVGQIPNGEVVQSYATGNVSGSDDTGGLLGRAVLGSSVTARNSFATGNVTSAGDAGGLVGYGNSTMHVDNVYATGLVTVTFSPFAGGGIIGGGNPGTIASSSFWDTTTTGVADACYAVIGACGGSGLATTLMKTKSTFTDAGWDFTSIWAINSTDNNGYPYLISRPSILCEESHVTATTTRAACQIQYERAPDTLPATTWQARYRKAGDTDWTNVTIDDSSVGKMTFHSLDPSTSYELGLKPTNEFIDNWAMLEATTRSADSDVDADGVLDIVENLSPNKGDTNNDGILDSEQARVTSMKNSITDKYVVLQTDGCDPEGQASVNSLTSIIAQPTDHKDAAYNYPAGVMSFTVRCATPCCPCSEPTIVGVQLQSQNNGQSNVGPACCPCGPPPTETAADPASIKVTQYFYGDYTASQVTARKYNSVTHTYTTISGAAITNVTIGGQNALKIVYTVVDNGPLDENATVGTVTDPSGPAISIVNVPNTGLRN